MLSDAELLARLVAFDTTSGRPTRPLADFVCEYASDRARVERQPSPDGERANLVLRFGPEAQGREGLVACGHMDVVPAGEPEWRGDPFELRDEGDRLYGRGACDMKGFLAVALNVALEADALGAPLVLLLTYDEEVGTLGARRFAEHWSGAEPLPRAAIVGEPTGLRVVRMHKGHVRMRVALRGVPAHSGYPHLGRSAIEAAARVLVSLRGLRHRLERQGGPNREFFPEVPFVPLNVGTIRGGSAANVVPDRCVMELDARPLPGMESEPVVAAVREAVANAAGDAPFDFEVAAESPPLLLDRDSRIFAELCALAGQTGDHGVSYATDAGWLARAGLECAVCGPGSIDVAHKPNEFVSKRDLAGARELLRRAIGRLCS